MQEKYTVITGCDSGIGESTAKKFGAIGKNVIITGVHSKKLETLKKEILSLNSNVKVITIVADLEDEDNTRKFYSETKKYEIETWINNAGVADFGPLATEEMKKILRQIHLNVLGYAILSKLFVTDYKDVKGTQLINIGSRVGYDIAETAVIYSATKCFVHGLTEGIYHELQRDEKAEMEAKLFAPNVVKSNFYETATGVPNADDYLEKFSTSDEIAEFIYELHQSNNFLGIIDNDFKLELKDPQLGYAENNVTQ